MGILRRFDEAPYHPFEYMQSLYFVTVPPLWFYTINPRVDALREVATGKTATRCYNNMSTDMTEDDKRCKFVGYSWLTFCCVAMPGLSLATDWFTVEPSVKNAPHFIKI